MVTQAEVHNVLKKWSATVTKRDAETGLPQGDATLSGAVYGVFKGEELVDTYITDESGQFTTTDYVCGDDWTIRNSSPSEVICWTIPCTRSAQSRSAIRQNIIPLRWM